MNIKVKEFPDNLEWVNTDTNQRLKDYRGKAVLIVFWSLSSVHSQQAQRDVRYLQNKFDDNLAVIGVHVPRFEADKSSAIVLKAVNQQHIRHPVVNDNERELWGRFGAQGWPTFALIDPEGFLVQIVTGERRRQELEELLDKVVEQAIMAGNINMEPLEFSGKKEAQSTLSFPNCVLQVGERLYISDTGNNRILEANLGGRVSRQFGSGNPGFWDGAGQDAGFNSPMAMAYLQEYLYVVDAGNHAIRSINILSGEATTIAGDSKRGRPVQGEFDNPRTVSLNYPTGISCNRGGLFISMSGQHQIWHMDLSGDHLRWYSGAGEEAIADGAPLEAMYAYPSGLSHDDHYLYVCDSSGSALRRIALKTQEVETLIGNTSQEFGLRDGTQSSGRLQNPMGVTIDRSLNRLYISDSLNNKIRVFDLRSSSLDSFNAQYEFDRPGGIFAGEDGIWVANTNAHVIVKMNKETAECLPIEIITPDNDLDIF